MYVQIPICVNSSASCFSIGFYQITLKLHAFITSDNQGICKNCAAVRTCMVAISI